MKFWKRRKSDKGSAELVTALFVIPIMFSLIITLIDASVLFLNRSTVESIARDSARTVAIMGGNGNETNGSPLEKAYGKTLEEACAGLTQADGYDGKNTVIECSAIQSLKNVSLPAATIESVKCSPFSTSAVGQEVTCTVKWDYGHIPGISFIPFGNANETVGTSVSEVNMTGIAFPRR